MIDKISNALTKVFTTDTRRIHINGINGKHTTRQVFPQKMFQDVGLQENLPSNQNTQEKNFRGIFFRCIAMRANLMSQGMIGFSVNRQTDQNESEQVEMSHPWVTLLHNPSKGIIPPKAFYKWVSESYDLNGHADMIVQRGPGNVPERLLPVFKRFGEVYPIPSGDGSTSGWVFYRHDGYKETYAKEDVIRVGRMSPFSPWDTISLLQAAMLDLDIDLFMKQFRKKSVEERGLPSNVLISDQTVSQDQANEYASRIKEFAKKNKVLTLGKGLTPWSQTAKELEFIEGLIQTKDDIKDITGVPRGMFSPDSNRASANSLRFQFIEDTINPELEDISGWLTFGLELSFGSEGLFIKVPNLKPSDPEEERKNELHLIQTSQKSQNDLLRNKGEEEVPHGDTYWISPGLMPVNQAMRDPFSSAEPNEEPIQDEDEDRSYTEQELTRLWRQIDRTKAFETRMARASVDALFDKWEEIILSKFNEQTRGVELSIDNLLDESRLNEELEDQLKPSMVRLIRRGYEVGAAQVNLDLPFELFEVRDGLESLLRKTKSVSGTLKERLGDKVEQAIREGKTSGDVESLIKGFFDEDMQNRAGTVAQTMTNSGFEEGQLQSYSKAGIENKRWLSQRDGNVRITHESADGQEVGINDYFRIGNVEMRHPSDPETDSPQEVINCRCSMLPV